jgi:hypothetical protein
MGNDTLSILSAYTDPVTQEMTCVVYPDSQLYIKKLIIDAYADLEIPIGILRPGTKKTPATRTIFVDSNDPVFDTPAPFSLTVTFDDGYRLTEPLQVVEDVAIQSVMAPFNFAPVNTMSPEEAAIFVTQAVKAAAARLNPPGGDAIPLDADARAQAEKGRVPIAPAASKNGHGKHAHR